jgi:CBS domain-containing protein/sporulation protein YlmC with PRC-barrel domain
MLYFSQLQGKKVTTQQKSIGKLKDFVFLANESPLITKIVVQTPRKELLMIPVSYLKTMDGVVEVDKGYTPVEKNKNNELYVSKNLLNRQIIDIKGEKVVRVNDVAIQDREGKEFYIAGVDIGFRAVLRWVHLERPTVPLYRALGIYSQPHFLSWGDIEQLELAQGKVKLKKDRDELERMRPEDLADYLEKTNIRNVNRIIGNLNDKFAADVIADLNVNYQTTLFKRFASEKGAKLVEHLDPDEAVDILLALSKEKRKEILELLPEEIAKGLRELIHYSKTPIGELITPEFITVSAEDTVGTALEKVKEAITDSHFSAYVYVTNQENELVGVIDLSQLILKPHGTPIFDIMEQDVVVIHLTTPKEIATKKMLRYKLYALPVIEGDKRVIGVVTYDDLVEGVLEKL